MGHTQSVNTASSRNVSVTSTESGFGGGSRPKFHKEHKRHGVVTMKMTLHNPTRRNSEQHITQTITPKGCILYGSLAFDPAVVQHGKPYLFYTSTFALLLMVPSAIFINFYCSVFALSSLPFAHSHCHVRLPHRPAQLLPARGQPRAQSAGFLLQRLAYCTLS